jgi:hypothetical protein
MKEALLLMAVQRQIGRVQIDHDLFRRFRIGFQENVHQQLVSGCGIVLHLLVAVFGLKFSTQFQTIQRALARQRFVRFRTSSEQQQQRIFAQLFVIIQVLVAERKAVYTLRQHLAYTVAHSLLISSIQKTTTEPA